jgi:hypothetical protein
MRTLENVRASLDTRRVERLPNIAKVREVGGNRCGRARAREAIRRRIWRRRVDGLAVLDQAVVVHLLNPLVDHRSRPRVGHVTKESVLVREVARLHSVAASLGHEDGDVEVEGVCLQLVIAGLLVRRVATPGVGIEREEVNGFGLVTAGKTDEALVLVKGPGQTKAHPELHCT